MAKKYIIAIGVISVIFTLLLTPTVCIEAAKDGLLLWFNKVLPSLLPFIILINILSQLNIMKGISRLSSPITKKIWGLPGSSLFVFIMGFIAGYPMGAKVIKQLIDTKTLSPKEGEKLLCFTNNCGPLFIIGTIGTLMLKSPSSGYFLLAVHILSALLISLIFSCYNARASVGCPLSHTRTYLSPIIFSHLLNDAVKNAMDTIVYIGGYIIFFSVIAKIINSSPLTINILSLNLIPNLSPPLVLGALTGLFELSNGASMICQLSFKGPYALALVAFMIGFGGLCVHFQTAYILEGSGLSLMPYILAKTMQGILSFILFCLFYPIFSLYTLKTHSAFEAKWLFILAAALFLFIYIVKALNQLSKYNLNKSLKSKYTYNC